MEHLPVLAAEVPVEIGIGIRDTLPTGGRHAPVYVAGVDIHGSLLERNREALCCGALDRIIAGW